MIQMSQKKLNEYGIDWGEKQFTREEVKPFVKWAGGKRQLLSELDRHLPDEFKTYYEPFVGGGALFFHLFKKQRIKNAIISDSNEELINAYLVIRDHVEQLIEALRSEQFKNAEETYYQIREKFNEIRLAEKKGKQLRIKRAAMFLYLNRTCYNGLWRVNKSGEYNVPFGRYTNPHWCKPKRLRAVSHALQNIKIASADFEEVLFGQIEGIKAVGSKDFIYFDPPYNPVSDTANFTSYTRSGFGKGEQNRLQTVFKKLDRKGALLLESNSDVKFIRELYQAFTFQTVQARRSISSDASTRGATNELLIKNY